MTDIKQGTNDFRRWLLAALSLALVVVFFLIDLRKRSSPGPLAAVHAELAAPERCADCHGRPGQSLAEACGACHEDIRRAQAAEYGLHGLAAVRAADCADCHSEHHGREFALIASQSFLVAGFAERTAYAHEGVNYHLDGAHNALACRVCHRWADVPLLPLGESRFLGLAQDCATCHEDPHQGRITRACQDCHGQSAAFSKLSTFQHTRDFALSGAHAIADCKRCHDQNGGYAVEALAGAAAPTPRTCVDCHAAPHSSVFLANTADSLAQGCAECHPSETGGFRLPLATLSATEHSASGFTLDGPHSGVACAACHDPGGPDALAVFAERYPGRLEGDCQLCHGQAHPGEFLQGAFAQANCVDCHNSASFHPSTFDLAQHARTVFPLEHSHAAVPCASCHLRNQATGKVQFSATPTQCSTCHQDAHFGAFVAQLNALSPVEDCGYCHQPTSFSQWKTDRFNHATWTTFALRGAHEQAECSACHWPSAAPDEAGRHFGRIDSQRLAGAESCAGCHVDVHGAIFERTPPSLAPIEEEGCARCHDEQSWQDARTQFAHAAWTGFELTGAHEQAQCSSCHPARAKADEHGRRFGRVEERFGRPVSRCQDCHVDPHAGAWAEINGELAAEAGGSCGLCHSTDRWQLSSRQSFDHARWTGFALAGAHEQLDCESCHKPEDTDSGAARHLGFAAGNTCSACHEDPHYGQFVQQGRTDCARCHTDQGSFELALFDHNRDSRFGLDVQHNELACSAYHKLAKLVDGTSTVRYKPLGTTCVECHGTTGVKQRGDLRKGER